MRNRSSSPPQRVCYRRVGSGLDEVKSEKEREVNKKKNIEHDEIGIPDVRCVLTERPGTRRRFINTIKSKIAVAQPSAYACTTCMQISFLVLF